MHMCLAPFYLALGMCATSALFALCKQENTLDIALDTLLSLVFISQVKECLTRTLQILQTL